MCALKSLKSIACTSPRTNDIIAALSSSSASLSCSWRATSNLTGFLTSSKWRLFSSFTAKPDPRRAPTSTRTATREAPPIAKLEAKRAPWQTRGRLPLAVSAPFRSRACLQRRRRRRWIRRRRRRGRAPPRHPYRRASPPPSERRRRVDLVAHRERRLGPHASRHLVHHLPARRSRLRFDIGQTRGGGGAGVGSRRPRSLLPRGSHQRAVHPRERVRLTVPAIFAAVPPSYPRREGGSSPSLRRRTRVGAVAAAARTCADRRVAAASPTTPWPFRRSPIAAHRLGHFPGGGERGGGGSGCCRRRFAREEEMRCWGDAPIRAG